jgi:hypothetical protein
MRVPAISLIVFATAIFPATAAGRQALTQRRSRIRRSFRP